MQNCQTSDWLGMDHRKVYPMSPQRYEHILTKNRFVLVCSESILFHILLIIMLANIRCSKYIDNHDAR
jgi:hypothetical protein